MSRTLRALEWDLLPVHEQGLVGRNLDEAEVLTFDELVGRAGWQVESCLHAIC